MREWKIYSVLLSLKLLLIIKICINTTEFILLPFSDNNNKKKIIRTQKLRRSIHVLLVGRLDVFFFSYMHKKNYHLKLQLQTITLNSNSMQAAVLRKRKKLSQCSVINNVSYRE